MMGYKHQYRIELGKKLRQALGKIESDKEEEKEILERASTKIGVSDEEFRDIARKYEKVVLENMSMTSFTLLTPLLRMKDMSPSFIEYLYHNYAGAKSIAVRRKLTRQINCPEEIKLLYVLSQ